MESIPSRVNDLERTTHTHEHRITQLEHLPPRVGDVEANVKAMNVTLTHIQTDSGEIKAGMKQLSEQQRGIAEAHNTMTGTINGFVKAGKILGVLLTMATIANLVISYAQ